MPIYEYECERHGSITREEMLVLGTDQPPAPPCSWCGLPMRKIMSECTFNLKGRGWARDGYSNKMTPENNPANKDNPAAVAADHADRAEFLQKL